MKQVRFMNDKMVDGALKSTFLMLFVGKDC